MMTEGELFREAVCLEGHQDQHKDHYLYIDRGHSICLVAHLDTVRKRGTKLDLIQHNNIITNRHGILGADDRAGVYGLFALEDTGCNLLFTNYEESGGVGAYSASQFLDFKDVKLFIELDRKGANDYVFYTHALPKKIKQYVESYGFIEDFGSYSDIAEFEEHRIPAVNLSIGYHFQHTAKERLHLDEMELTLSRVRRMIENPPTTLHLVPSLPERTRYDILWEDEKRALLEEDDDDFSFSGDVWDRYRRI